jgi:hypothetical protein
MPSTCRYADIDRRFDVGRPSAASRYIEPIDNMKPGDRAFAVLRVSSTEQGKAGNLIGQRVNLPRAVEARGGVVVGSWELEWSGHGTEWEYLLVGVGDQARECGANIVVLADPTRVCRSRHFRADSAYFRQAQANEHDIAAAVNAINRLNDLRVMTVLHPDATNEEGRLLLSRWAQQAKDHKGGRPRKPDRAPGWRERRRDEMLPKVLELHHQGLNFSRIAERVNEESRGRYTVTRYTVRDWLREAGVLRRRMVA